MAEAVTLALANVLTSVQPGGLKIITIKNAFYGNRKVKIVVPLFLNKGRGGISRDCAWQKDLEKRLLITIPSK